jgi:hypothetical protein
MKRDTCTLALWLALAEACAAAAAAPAGDARELRQWGKAIVPRVRVEDDAAFFAAWNLDHPGMEAVKAAVVARDYDRAKVELKRYFAGRRLPRWQINHWEMPARPRGKSEQHSRYQAGQRILAHDFSYAGFELKFGKKIDWNHFPLTLPNGRPDTEFPPIHELNRFHRVSRTLGPLYWFSRDERYARELVEEITDAGSAVAAWPGCRHERRSPGLPRRFGGCDSATRRVRVAHPNPFRHGLLCRRPAPA